MTPQDSASLRLEPLGGSGLEPISILEEETVLIGRAVECDVCLMDGGISRRHAELSYRDGTWLVTDVGSSHGTILNGVPLHPDVPMAVADGDLLRFGPFTFRVVVGDSTPDLVATMEDARSPATIVQPVPNRELDTRLQRRLELLIEGAAALSDVQDEQELARSVLKLALDGSGFHRAAMLRTTRSLERVEVVASCDLENRATGFSFSRSLLAAAAEGHTARLSQDIDQPRGQSIVGLGITDALCAPVIIDATVIGAVYLDSRDAERPGFADAAGFCHAVSKLAGLALSNLKRAALAKRQEKLESDLQAARRAQTFLAVEDEGVVGSLRYATRTRPGSVVMGDLFDIFAIGEDAVGICCGDVTGHGVAAGVLMTATVAYLRAALERYGEPAAAMNATNEYITRRTSPDMFVSLWAGVFSRSDGALRYVDAGHGHWLLKPAGEASSSPPRPHALILGIDPGFDYTSRTINLKAGDRIILYTDGVVEHRDSEGELFGTHRLTAAIDGSDSPATDVSRTLAALDAFDESRGLADDTTIASVAVVDHSMCQLSQA